MVESAPSSPAPNLCRILGKSVPPACFYGCPTTDFKDLEQRAVAAQTDVAKATDSGISQGAVEAVERYVAGLDAEIKRTVWPDLPEHSDGPWRPDPQALAEAGVRHGVLKCCRFAGIVIVGNNRTTQIDRPTVDSPNS